MPVRVLKQPAPVIVQPYPAAVWGSAKRLRATSIWTMPESVGGITDPFFWMPVFRQDVTLWPTDIVSTRLFGLFVDSFNRDWSPLAKSTLGALRWAWGSPLAEELGEPPAEIETLWRRPESEQKAA